MRSLPVFPGQIELQFDHCPLIVDLLARKNVHSSDFAMYNLLGWYLDRPPMISRVDDHLILDVEGPDGSHVLLPPLGIGSPKAALEAMLRYGPILGFTGGISYVPEEIFQEILPVFPPLRTEELRGDFDYLYNRQELSELSGRKFHQKKNFVNRLLQAEKPVVSLLTPALMERARAYLNTWYAGAAKDDLSVKLESLAAERMLPNLQKIGGMGILVELQGEIVGLSVASPIHSKCWVVTVEKANREIKGMYQFVNWALANRLPEEVKVINRETDLDIVGLRVAKLSYHPIGFEKKYRLYFSTSVKSVENPV